MKKNILEPLLLTSTILVISIFYFSGLVRVPFHPDESTQIFTSADVDDFLKNPASLFWSATQPVDNRLYYRLVDPPLTREWIGVVRSIAGFAPTRMDWDWSLSWDENMAQGAFPGARLLLLARWAVAIVFPLTLLLAYLLGKTIRSKLLGWLNLALTASNALVLLHTRRAMAESFLFFFCLLTLWLVFHLKRHAWLAMIPAALAFNAKYSLFPLALLVAIAVLWTPPGSQRKWSKRIFALVASGALFLAITFALNPVLWGSPIQAARAAIAARSELMARQTSEIQALSSDQTAITVGSKAAALIGELFILPPAAQDVGNYAVQIDPQNRTYLSNPLNNLLRGFVAGGFFFILCLAGLIFWIIQLFRRPPEGQLRNAALLLLAFFLQFLAQIALYQVIFQRYYLTLISFTTLFSATELVFLVETIKNKTD